MITAFFKPKSTPKVTPDGPSTSPSTAKRALDHPDGKGNNNNKRLKSTSLDKNHSDAVHELLSYLNDAERKGDETTTTTTTTWSDILQKHATTASSFARLAEFVASQRKSHKVYPPAPDTFSALNHTPLEKVKVVIVGQDPYHGPNQAHGLCFSVRRGIKTPPSLHNMYKELIQDPDIENFKDYPSHGNLERWAHQGVLMINTVMTVRQGEPNSHQNKGWEAVTDEIIRAVDRRAKQKSTKGNKPVGVVFLLWGKPATAKCETALGVSNLSSSSQAHRHIICTSHPSPLGATKTKSPFMGSKCFSRANEALKTFGYDELIDWRVDGALP